MVLRLLERPQEGMINWGRQVGGKAGADFYG